MMQPEQFSANKRVEHHRVTSLVHKFICRGKMGEQTNTLLHLVSLDIEMSQI